MDPLGVRLSHLFSPSSPPATVKMLKLPAGSWEGSIVAEDHIEHLHWTQKLPSEDVLKARTPEGERALEPRDGERVFFSAHIPCGLRDAGELVTPALPRLLQPPDAPSGGELHLVHRGLR
ncbi:hypothetical protein D1007_47393 [Hordeum vulgare]|nr:hypothetical protein D1007_47393 [Hordeum vulgare]